MARILAVDDDDSVRDFYRLALGTQGHEVAVSGDVADALRKARTGRFDLVLLDIRLPGASGYEFLGAVAKLASPPAVIVVSGADDPDGLIRELEGGAIDHVSKPVSFEDLDRAVAAALTDRAGMERRRDDLLEEARAHGTLSHLLGSSGNGKAVAIDIRDARRTREGAARILVVEDDPTIRGLVEAIVRLMGHRPVPAADGDEALELLAAKRFDLVILDIMLPGTDGYEVLRRMRELAGHRTTPVVVVTAKHDAEGILREIDGGAVDHVAKPYRTQELQDAIARALGARLESEERRKVLAATARTYDDVSSLWEAARTTEDPYARPKRASKR